jgi:hypothetical protein
MLKAMVYCTRCWCGLKADAWDENEMCLMSPLAGVGSETPMPQYPARRPGPENCDGECPCHTFVGMMPMIGLAVGESSIAKVLAAEQAAMDERAKQRG